MTGSSVKNLVNFYDTPADLGTSSASQDSSRDATHPSQASRFTSADPLSPSQPSPTPARFLHPSSRDYNDSKLESSSVPSSTTAVARSTAVDVDTLPDSTTDVADEWQPGVVHFREGSRNRRVKNWLLTGDASPESEEQYLLSTVTTKETLGFVAKDLDGSRGNDARVSSAATAVTASNHIPVPAATVFARKAAPLALPDLDTYIASLPMPSFHTISQAAKRKAGDVPMFIPMDRLAASGKSIEDLETNSQVRPFWRNRNSIFSALVDIALGITGSSALATFYSLQGLFNTLQLFALVLSTIGSHDKASIKDDWRQVFLDQTS
ncbi:hypothetical protein EWM64_g1361 [Hericium alpestre]|uniref:Uncharacterized protein n=1 Tax=Hericium alpestre TaxID=135208 RepID=A0A4Z0A833_9AGAM|nr:hypothetical protein EWM64_g1361 [Hericium alpestre]